MNPFHLSEPAATELTEAVRWYEERRPGWGARLFDAVTRTIELVQEHPEVGAPRTGPLPTRQYRAHGFPYLVTYRIREQDIYVVAIAHASRRPGYWMGRE